MSKPLLYARGIVCGKWELPFYVPLTAACSLSDKQQPYLLTVANKPNVVSTKALCVEWLLEGVELKKNSSCVEFLGGVGLTATILRGLFGANIKRHYLSDLDEGCVLQLKRAFPNCEVGQGDAKELSLKKTGDLVWYDFPSFNAGWLKDWKDSFDAVFRGKPRYFLLTDTSSSKLPLFREQHSKTLEYKVHELGDYVKGMSNWFLKRYEFSVSRVAHRHLASHYLLEPGERKLESRWFPRDNSGKGFHWLE